MRQDVVVRIEQRSATDPVVVELATAQQVEVSLRYGDTPDHGFGQPPLHQATIWLVAFDADQPMGVVAIQPVSHTLPGVAPDIGEIKRLYIDPGRRGHGYAADLMAAAEGAARNAGFTRLQLETGTRQPEALALYSGTGWTEIPPYGHYRDSPKSICFEKVITGTLEP